ncbi:hypothetical protein RFI_33528 [Reticulomyxa filosa]|uniref:Uncharacterized protein n=1 Tax=Reticulomyxa filosa TaxID=46433 RepID=X6LQK0_RETFI|nr:hypothetical protein RFI_33528 [Reticulomyxa filosa]|eukprot:ETO03874.1 hypothetical protein RFI_33528 [Reticulomyxa filosa]
MSIVCVEKVLLFYFLKKGKTQALACKLRKSGAKKYPAFAPMFDECYATASYLFGRFQDKTYSSLHAKIHSEEGQDQRKRLQAIQTQIQSLQATLEERQKGLSQCKNDPDKKKM